MLYLVWIIAPMFKLHIDKNNIKRLLSINSNLLFKWALLSNVAFLIFGTLFVLYPIKSTVNTNNKYTIYASKPLVLNESTFEIDTTDARVQKIDNVFRDYKCPLEGLGDVFVKEADKNNIPWYIVAAISFQESGCGKKIPYVDSEPSYNAWGYGVYGENVHEFDNWVQGIEVMSRYLSKRFYAQGVTDTSDIMKTYTPPSMGSWYKGVDYFSDLIQNYSTK
jgi:hypothetical protein